MNLIRLWLLPFALLSIAAVALFSTGLWADAMRTTDPSHIWSLVLRPNPYAAAQTLSNAAQVVAAVLAIAITVVAIVVELAANRYAHRITKLFVRAPTNLAVMGFFVVAALECVWVTLMFDQ